MVLSMIFIIVTLLAYVTRRDTAVRLRTEKILVYSALAIIIIMSYAYAASVPQSNAPGGFDYNPVGFGSPRMGIYAIIGLAVIVGIAYFLSKR